MARVKTFRARAWLAAAVLIAANNLSTCARTWGQVPVMMPGGAMPAGQPMWVGSAPSFPVGADGAINLDEPMAMGPGMGTPYWGDPNACATQPCPPCAPASVWMMPQQPCPPAVQPRPLQASVFGDFLWLHPTGVDMAHAQQQDGLGGAGTVPFGEIGTLDPDYDIGFRLGAELRIAPDAGIFGSYTFFEADATSSIDAPNVPGGGGAVGSLVHHPNASITGSAGPVDATYDIEFRLADLAYRQLLMRSCVHYVSAFVGARFAQLDQEFAQTGIFGGGLGGAIDTTSTIEYTGAGPLAGIDAAHQVGKSRFSVYGRGLVAIISGEFDSRYRMFNDTTDVQLALSTWQDDRIVPMLDYEFGIAWTGPQGHFRLAAGYMGSHWFNAVSTATFIDAVQADNYVNVGDTISFDGLVGRVEWTF